MAIQDTTEDEILDDNQAEVENEDDESSEDESQENDEIDSEDETDDEGDESEDDEPEFTKAFSQIKGDTLEDYTPNLEEAYRKSSREGRKLSEDNKELQGKLDVITAVIAKNPELAKAIEKAGAQDVIVDPAILKMRQDMQDQQAKEYGEFSDSHPRLEAEDDLREDIFATMKELADASRKRGRQLGMTEALKKAWIIVVGDEDDQEKIVDRAKDTVSKKKNGKGGKKLEPKTEKLTAAQIAVGKRFGLSEKQLLEANK